MLAPADCLPQLYVLGVASERKNIVSVKTGSSMVVKEWRGCAKEIAVVNDACGIVDSVKYASMNACPGQPCMQGASLHRKLREALTAARLGQARLPASRRASPATVNPEH